jgi:uncharacterized repeat protein (TIGR03803 family)
VRHVLNEDSSVKKSLLTLVCAAFTFSLAVCAQAQTLNYFVDLTAGNGWEPYASVVQASDGNFYGTGTNGIYGGGGNMFRMTPSGTVTSIYKFCSQPNCADGAASQSAPIVGPDGNLYGVMAGGGNGSCGQGGVVYKMTLDAKITVLHRFSDTCTDGSWPNGIILASDGNFYGTTVYGGVGEDGPGTIFKITPSGTYTQLYSFCAEANCADGERSYFAPVQGNDGNFYGAANSGGTFGSGVIYKLTASGKYSVIYNFCNFENGACPEGSYPYAISKDAEGNFVGTADGGTSGYGVIFKITPSGHYTVLHSFAPDGNVGWAGTPLTLASDGNLYGTFNGGGSGSWAPFARGGIYEVTAQGAYKPLYGFCPPCNSSGFTLLDPLFQGTDGNFYGTTAFGGKGGWHGEAFGFGTVFQFSNNLIPFVRTVPGNGKPGESVIIMGYGLSGTTGVLFNGVQANFTGQSDTYLKATIPAGATTGAISVITSSGTLNSNPQFIVTR